MKFWYMIPHDEVETLIKLIINTYSVLIDSGYQGPAEEENGELCFKSFSLGW
jgi:hypothetical protein